MAEAAAFDNGAAEKFAHHSDTVRGDVRHQVAIVNLFNWLPNGPLEVLDFGGGNGIDSLRLADMGENVTLLDESKQMIKLAKQAVAARDPDLKGSVKPIEGSLDNLESGKTFEVILNHCALTYEVDQPEIQLRDLADRLRPNGILSLIVKGRGGVISLLGDNDAAMAEFNRTGRYRYTNNLGLEAQAFDPRLIIPMLSRAGLTTRKVYGVRAHSNDDRRLVKDVSQEELGEIINLELETGRDLARLNEAQLMQIIAMKLPEPKPTLL